jgi:signal transduction histidine kinase
MVAGICDLVDAACVNPNTVETVDGSELVAEEVAEYRNRVAQRGVRLSVAGDRAVRCAADSRRLRRALRELLDNAVAYAPRQSAVCVAATFTVAGVAITVRDHGTGIDPTDRSRLARPFERGTHPRRPTSGLGMGLALSSAVATGHGGQLVLADGYGGGLEARLELPLDCTRATDTTAAR